MPIVAEVITSWTSNGGNSPTLANTYKPIAISGSNHIRVRDGTAQEVANIPPSVNLYIVQVWTDASVFSQLQSDANYKILWDTTGPDYGVLPDVPAVVPDAAEFGLLVAWLSSRGVNTSSVIGDSPAGRTRLEITDTLREHFRITT